MKLQLLKELAELEELLKQRMKALKLRRLNCMDSIHDSQSMHSESSMHVPQAPPTPTPVVARPLPLQSHGLRNGIQCIHPCMLLVCSWHVYMYACIPGPDEMETLPMSYPTSAEKQPTVVEDPCQEEVAMHVVLLKTMLLQASCT